MNISDYSYNLPDELIALNPPTERGTSRLLVVHRDTNKLENRRYADIVSYLESGDILILNDTKVLKARLQAVRTDGAVREIIILEKHGSTDDWYTHKILYRRKLSIGDELRVGDASLIVIEVLGDGLAVIRSSHDLLELAAKHGSVPLPPYMHREATAMDVERYQTIWANETGSVAAPTASLNMTDRIVRALQAKGVVIRYITLHVGLGTFLPIRTDTVEEHHMHKEYFHIDAETISAIQDAKLEGKRVVALGTTVARTLEYAAEGLKHAPKDISGEADIFIYPGYVFRSIDVLLTNFHAPKSTVLMLTAAFAGWGLLRDAYEHAIQDKYHFLSYGDSMLIL